VIEVTRLKGGQMALNAELVEMVESTPDTVVSLTTGRKVLVQEPVDEVMRRIIAYRRSLRMITPFCKSWEEV